MEQLTPSKIPTIGNACQATKNLITGASLSMDPDKIKLEKVYREASDERYSRICSYLPLVRTEAVVAKPMDILDVERCETIKIMGRLANTFQVALQAQHLEDGDTDWIWKEDGYLHAIDYRNELFARKLAYDGVSTELLEFRHTDVSTVPYGLRQTVYTLEHDKGGRFFRGGGGVAQTASPSGTTVLSSGTSQQTGISAATALALTQRFTGADPMSTQSNVAFPAIVLPPIPTAPTATTTATAATPTADQSVLQRIMQQLENVSTQLARQQQQLQNAGQRSYGDQNQQQYQKRQKGKFFRKGK
jgi:hypothetical protein